MADLRNFFNKGIISFYGYSHTHLPTEIDKSKYPKINIFFKDAQFKKINNPNLFNFQKYYGYKGVTYGDGDIIFLDQDAIKSICIGYPTNAKYLLISLKFFKYYFFILIGLLRRKINRTIKINGIIWLNINSNKVPWLLIENLEVQTNSLNISSTIGVQGLLNYLAKENISYFVPRFYDSLPDLSSDNADLDLLVENRYIKKVNNFLISNPGKIKVDIYSDVGLDYYGMPYFPPYKAKEILERTIEGPGNSKIPNNYDSLLLLIYHILYHKGFLSGLPSRFISTSNNIENKYLLEINKLNKNLNIKLGKTLEELDEFMFTVGWRPAIDTLTKISEWNEWVLRYHIKKEKSNLPLYILVLKNICIGKEEENKLVKECKKQNLKIIEERVLSKSIQSRAIREIRGGVWNDSLEINMKQSDYHPGKIYVIWDRIGSRAGGFSYLKEKLRKKIDQSGPSFIHSSDNYSESLDYINICMPDRLAYYQNKKLLKSRLSKYDLRIIKFSQIIPHLKILIRSLLINLLSH